MSELNDIIPDFPAPIRPLSQIELAMITKADPATITHAPPFSESSASAGLGAIIAR